MMLNLPNEVLVIIFNYLSYDEVSYCRLVCQRFNEISKVVLNQGFLKVTKFNQQCLDSTKSQLPRRKSERKEHPLETHFEIFFAIKIRLSTLSSYFNMLYSNMCCFFPGKILDEIYRILRYVTSVQTPIKNSLDLLEEMYDLSMMAINHLREKIAPRLEKQNDMEIEKLIDKKQKSMKMRKKLIDEKINIFSRIKMNIPDRPMNIPDRPMNIPDVPINIPYRPMIIPYRPMNIPDRSMNIPCTSHDKRIKDLEQFVVDCRKELEQTKKTNRKLRAEISIMKMKLYNQGLEIDELSELIAIREVGNEGSARKNIRFGTRRGRNGGRKTIITRATKRKLKQNLNDKTNMRGRKKSRRSS